MKKRILLTTLVATMVASTLLVGCGGKEEDKNNNTTTPATNVEQSDNNSKVEDSTKEDDTSKKEEAKAYDEKFYDEPDWEKEFEESKQLWLDKGWTEELAEKTAKSSVDEKKLEYSAMKFVFEDMTRRFKNKENVTTTETSKVADEECTSFVCDISKLVPEDYYDEDRNRDVVYERDYYKEFVGFDAKDTECTIREKKDGSEEIEYIKIVLHSNRIKGANDTPFYVFVTLDVNEDGTFSYREMHLQFMLYDVINRD